MDLDDREERIINAYRLACKHRGGPVDLVLRIRSGKLASTREVFDTDLTGLEQRAPPARTQAAGAGV